MTESYDDARNSRWALAGGGLTAGIIIGAAIGFATDNLALGIALAVVFALALGGGSQALPRSTDGDADGTPAS